MIECQECGDDVPSARQAMGIDVCVLCQQDLERSGMFVKSRIEIYQDIVGWSLEGINQKIITGGRKA